jgi:hypothetical protein
LRKKESFGTDSRAIGEEMNDFEGILSRKDCQPHTYRFVRVYCKSSPPSSSRAFRVECSLRSQRSEEQKDGDRQSRAISNSTDGMILRGMMVLILFPMYKLLDTPHP